jgi:hypothetical protein
MNSKSFSKSAAVLPSGASGFRPGFALPAIACLQAAWLTQSHRVPPSLFWMHLLSRPSWLVSQVVSHLYAFETNDGNLHTGEAAVIVKRAPNLIAQIGHASVQAVMTDTETHMRVILFLRQWLPACKLVPQQTVASRHHSASRTRNVTRDARMMDLQRQFSTPFIILFADAFSGRLISCIRGTSRGRS